MNLTPPNMNRGRQSHKAPRRAERARHEQIWNAKKKCYQKELENKYGSGVKKIDIFENPLRKGDVVGPHIPWENVALGLEQALKATGDSAFSDAIEALKSYGFDKGVWKQKFETVRNLVFGEVGFAYLGHMKWLLDRGRSPSIRAAAEDVAANYFVNGCNFETVTHDLRSQYSAWKNAGFPLEPAAVATDLGDLGYQVHVRPRPGLTVPDGKGGHLTEEGATVPYTRRWRFLYYEGSVEIYRVSAPK
jgi:hypothetical protein